MKFSAGFHLGLMGIMLICICCNGEQKNAVCEPGWVSFKENCYYAYKFPVYTYDEARTVCNALGGSLAKVNNVEEDLYLKGYTEGAFDMWLGANDVENEGVWKWEDGSSVTYSNWYNNQPGNAGRAENCLHFCRDCNQKWNDARCDQSMGFICSKHRYDSVCVEGPVGVENGEIPDSQITASSHSYSTRPYNGRLNYYEAYSAGWRAGTDNDRQWLQIDLGSEKKVTKVATQGRGDYHQWVNTYKLAYKEGDTWKYVEDNGSTVIFQGNTDMNTVVSHTLGDLSFITQYVRFHPVSWRSNVSMRVEVYACQ